MTSLRILTVRRILAAFTICLLSCAPPVNRQEQPAGWPSISRETKPWTRWWWHGSALTKEGITAEMEAYSRAGIGGLEITPIYGVYGEEEKFVEYLSPQWMDLLLHALKEAERLDMGIDMATGTGWPFGGPWVTSSDACKILQYKIFEVSGGSRLKEKVQLIQSPYLRLVGNNIYKPDSVGREPVRVMNTDSVKIEDLEYPIEKNHNLQILAIDQVQFEKPLKLQCLIAYGQKSGKIDLTSKVGSDGTLDWTPQEGKWKLYAVFEGFHGKMVERAGPGGEGNVIDHFSDEALKNYLSHFDEAFEDRDISSLRAFFNDSYEVDDARGAADFTEDLFDEFEDRRGYDLRDELPALFGNDEAGKNRRVLCDYRETLSELLLEKFTMRWKDWAHEHDALVRNQAHGAPSNILDLYSVVDIPEIEGTEPLRFKMATSSGHVTGKKLISAEAATWLNEHFQSSLGDIKAALDNFMLQGVNHLVYHGTCYSPPDEPWPGRLFYAAVHLNPRNPQWKDFLTLNTYVTRCQSFLQNSSVDNDILLYYPIYDRFSTPGPEMVEHFDGIGTFKGSSFEKCAELLLNRGFAFDYISDKQLWETDVENGLLKTSGDGTYKLIVVPQCAYIPLQTMEKLLQIAEHGGQILFVDKLPGTVSGLGYIEERKSRFDQIVAQFNVLRGNESPARKAIQITDNLASALMVAGVRRESMIDLGIQCLRKKNHQDEVLYFIKNASSKPFEGWLPLSVNQGRIIFYDPMTGQSGTAKSQQVNSRIEVFTQLAPGQTLIIAADNDAVVDEFLYRDIAGAPFVLKGDWNVEFKSGGPELPADFRTDSLIYWTNLKASSYRDFSGRASYRLTFHRPGDHSGRWLLQLDSVGSSVEVVLNGKTIGTLLGPSFQVEFDGNLLRDSNELQLNVSNLMANRIAYMDRNKIFWKKFYNVNFPARRRENARGNIFDASHWPPMPSGLSGNATMYPLK